MICRTSLAEKIYTVFMFCFGRWRNDCNQSKKRFVILCTMLKIIALSVNTTISIEEYLFTLIF